MTGWNFAMFFAFQVIRKNVRGNEKKENKNGSHGTDFRAAF